MEVIKINELELKEKLLEGKINPHISEIRRDYFRVEEIIASSDVLIQEREYYGLTDLLRTREHLA